MARVKIIVVPVDFAENTEKLVEYACYMANKLVSVMHFVHVVAPFQGDGMLGTPFVTEYQEKIAMAAKERMASLIYDKQEKCPGCSGQVLVGEPVEKIVDFASEIAADLIIISTHGAKGLEKILLGSVAERVLKRAHCPVLIMNPHKERRI